MGHNIEKAEGNAKKNMGKISGNRKMEIKGAAKESSAKIKDKIE